MKVRLKEHNLFCHCCSKLFFYPLTEKKIFLQSNLHPTYYIINNLKIASTLGNADWTRSFK